MLGRVDIELTRGECRLLGQFLREMGQVIHYARPLETVATLDQQAEAARRLATFTVHDDRPGRIRLMADFLERKAGRRHGTATAGVHFGKLQARLIVGLIAAAFTTITPWLLQRWGIEGARTLIGVLVKLLPRRRGRPRRIGRREVAAAYETAREVRSKVGREYVGSARAMAAGNLGVSEDTIKRTLKAVRSSTGTPAADLLSGFMHLTE